jgi:hypothetical protein
MRQMFDKDTDGESVVYKEPKKEKERKEKEIKMGEERGVGIR